MHFAREFHEDDLGLKRSHISIASIPLATTEAQWAAALTRHEGSSPVLRPIDGLDAHL
jgi:hypothetical protein